MRFLIVVFTLFVFADTPAQEYTFKVLINKGQNSVRSGDGWVPINVGASLNAADELKISRNGYLGLVHVSGKPLEVKEAGPHKVAELAASIKEGSSVLTKYTDFILGSQPDKQTNLTATGSVYRGSGAIKVFLPRAAQAIIFNDRISISWTKNTNTRLYVVQFNSMFGEELGRFEVRDTTLSINLAEPEFVNEDNIVVSVVSKSDGQIASDDFILKRLSFADKERIATALAGVPALTTEKNALNLLYLAAFYEENALLIDASTAYHQAVALVPEVPYYRKAYDEFILRNNLKN